MVKNQELLSLDGQHGPAKAITPQDRDVLIDSVLDQWAGPPVAVQPARSWLKAAGYALAVIVATSSVATAAWVYYDRTQTLPSIERKLDTPSPAPPPVRVVLETESPAPSPEEIVPVPSKRRLKPSKPKIKAEDLLKQANRLRRVQDWDRAARAYALVSKKFRGSDSEYVALVSEAEIQLRQLSDLARAKNCYQRASRLKPDGVLDAEILFGLAEVSQLQNNQVDELKFLRLLVQKYEHSPFAELAKERLEKR